MIEKAVEATASGLGGDALGDLARAYSTRLGVWPSSKVDGS